MTTRVLLTILLTMLISLVTCDEAGETTWNITGTWSCLTNGDDGGDFFTADFTQPVDTAAGIDSIWGTVHVEGGLPFAGTISGDHVEGVAMGGCSPDISLTVGHDGNEMIGTAVDQPWMNCKTIPEMLYMYRHRTPELNITGTWTGGYSGTDGSGSLVMVLAQTGSVVTGQLFSEDTLAMSGHVYGDDFLAEIVENDPDCSPSIVHLRITTNNMTGTAIGGGGASNDCIFTASVTLSGSAVLLRSLNRSPHEHH